MDLKDVQFESGMLKELREKPFYDWFEKYLVIEKNAMDETPYFGMTNLERYLTKKQYISEIGEAPLDAIEKTLSEYKLTINGPRTPQCKAFLETGNVRILWPEVISQTIYFKMMEVGLVEQMLPNVEVIDGWQYTKMFIEDTALDRSMGEIAPGEKIPEVSISAKEYESHLKKYGRRLKYTYENIQNKTFTTFKNVFLDKIALQLALDKTARMFYVFLNGDGDLGGLPAGNIEQTDVTTAVSVEDIIKFISATDSQYQITSFATPTTQWRKYVKQYVIMTNPSAQKKEMQLPIPAVHRWDGDNLTSDYFLGVDGKRVGAWVTNDTALLEESWKLIDTQEAETVVSCRGDITIYDRYALAALDINH